MLILNKDFGIKAVVVVSIILVLSVCGFLYLFGVIDNFFNKNSSNNPIANNQQNQVNFFSTNSEKMEMKKFTSAEEFKVYLEERQVANSNYAMKSMTAPAMDRNLVTQELGLMNGEAIGLGGTDDSGANQSATRVSETNVQVAGIDEPDIVKTNGKEIFLSSLYRLYYRTSSMPILNETIKVEDFDRAMEMGEDFAVNSVSRILPPQSYETAKTKIISAFPVADLAVSSEIDLNGNLLLKDNTLVVVGTDNKITGFNVSDKKNPSQVWDMKLNEKSYLVSSRLKDDVLYLMTAEYANISKPCPISPLNIGDQKVEIACADIYYPTVDTEIDTVYSLLALNVDSGEMISSLSFVGSGNSIMYMSENAAYLSYSYAGDMVKFMNNFFSENKDIVPSWVTDKLDKLMGYDLSNNAKQTELSMIVSKWQNSLSEDDLLTIENELANRGEKYYNDHRRELDFTGITKISLENLSVVATGVVSGRPLNQFSFDEFADNLRVATTIGEQGFWLGGGMMNSNGKTVSDVSILDTNLNTIGTVRDLGDTEKIYSVRFLGNRGYVVTFRQTDPFYVLDLSNPTNPEKKGELKIPGYSSYLHPLTENVILGVGKEDDKVKLSMFDVSNASEPKEINKYTLDEYYSEAMSNHHAFLQDKDHQVFFLPGSQGGYIFGYAGNELKLKKAIKEDQVSRAIYLDDFMYLIGQDKIVVLNENNWDRVGELDLTK
jgi:uncharacterized secreted protein with C-terminal beta-propeller domain